MRIENASEEKLRRICKIRSTDPYEQGGMLKNSSADCSLCKHFHSLSGEVGENWGVCTCPYGTRCAILTHIQTGCPYKTT